MSVVKRIVPLAQWCRSILLQLMKEPLDSDTQIWIETQAQRLDVWIWALGVLAQGDYSIEHRLKNNSQVASVVVQLLTGLGGNLRLCMFASAFTSTIISADTDRL